MEKLDICGVRDETENINESSSIIHELDESNLNFDKKKRLNQQKFLSLKILTH